MLLNNRARDCKTNLHLIFPFQPDVWTVVEFILIDKKIQVATLTLDNEVVDQKEHLVEGMNFREKGIDLTQSYDKSPYTHRKILKASLKLPMSSNLFDFWRFDIKIPLMSNLQKLKRFDLIDKFNDTSRYLDDILTIDKPCISGTYPPYLSKSTSVE